MIECITATPETLGNYWENPAYRPIVDANLVLWITSDFGNNETWTDLSGAENHGTIQGATRNPLHPLDIFGSALDFDGIDDYVDHGNPENLNLNDNFSLEARIYANDLTSYRMIGGKKGTDNPEYAGYLLYTHADFLIATIADGTYSETLNGGSISPGTWYHIVMTLQRPEFKLYVNGIERASRDVSSIGDITNNTFNFFTGRWGYNATSYSWKGIVAEARVYNRVLSEAESMHNYTHSPVYYIQI